MAGVLDEINIAAKTSEPVFLRNRLFALEERLGFLIRSGRNTESVSVRDSATLVIS